MSRSINFKEKYVKIADASYSSHFSQCAIAKSLLSNPLVSVLVFAHLRKQKIANKLFTKYNFEFFLQQ